MCGEESLPLFSSFLFDHHVLKTAIFRGNARNYEGYREIECWVPEVEGSGSSSGLRNSRSLLINFYPVLTVLASN